jgi:thioredoxin 2
MQDTLQVVCPNCTTVNRVPRVRLGEHPVCGRCKSLLFDGHPPELNATAFDAQISRSEVPVVVDFWAPWCGPCRTMAPAFLQTAKALEPHYRFAKVNTEEQQQLAARFNIRSIPTLAVFRSGREIARQAGAMDQATLTRWLQQVA